MDEQPEIPVEWWDATRMLPPDYPYYVIYVYNGTRNTTMPRRKVVKRDILRVKDREVIIAEFECGHREPVIRQPNRARNCWQCALNIEVGAPVSAYKNVPKTIRIVSPR